jgi:hypothetical protein
LVVTAICCRPSRVPLAFTVCCAALPFAARFPVTVQCYRAPGAVAWVSQPTPVLAHALLSHCCHAEHPTRPEPLQRAVIDTICTPCMPRPSSIAATGSCSNLSDNCSGPASRCFTSPPTAGGTHWCPSTRDHIQPHNHQQQLQQSTWQQQQQHQQQQASAVASRPCMLWPPAAIAAATS